MQGDFNFDINDYVIRRSLSNNLLVAIPMNDFTEKTQLKNPLFKSIKLNYNNELKQYELTDKIEEVLDYDTELIIIQPI